MIYPQPRPGVSTPATRPAAPPIGAPHFDPESAHRRTGPEATEHFTHEEMTATPEHEVRQKSGHLPTLYQHAAAHKEWLDNVIDREKGLSSKLGLHVVEGHSPTPEDYAAGHRKGGMVILAPLKGEKRAKEKIEGKGGDYRQLKDVSRATIAVSHPDDIAHVTHHLRQAGMPLAGAPDYKKTDAGYQDITVRPQHPQTGHVGELQIMPIDMLQAKQHGLGGEAAGHKLYEGMRSMKPADLETPEGKVRYQDLNARSNRLYGQAVRNMEGRTPVLGKKGGLMKGQGKRRSHFHHPDVARRGRPALSAGYYSWDGQPAVRRAHASWPQMLVRGQWKHVPDLGKFDHEATRVSESTFLRMIRGRATRGGRLAKAIALKLLLERLEGRG